MKIHEPLYPFDHERVFGIKVIAFDEFDRLLAVKKGRSFDIINGCQEWDDDSFEDAARREAYEQAGATLEHLTVSAVIEHESDENQEVEDSGPFYTLVITGYVEGLEEWPPEQAVKRGFFKKEVFLKRYRFGNAADIKTLVEMAHFASVNQKEAQPKKHSSMLTNTS